MIKIREVPRQEAGTWYYQIYGPDSIDGTVRLGAVESADDPETWLAANAAEAQALVDAGRDAGEFSRRQELKNFVADNPGARQLVELGPVNLETAIENRTANQETLLHKTQAFVTRWLIARALEEG